MLHRTFPSGAGDLLSRAVASNTLGARGSAWTRVAHPFEEAHDVDSAPY